MKFEDMGAKPSERPLTPKQAAFVREYLIDLNGAQAAIRAGYSAKSADRIAHELLKETPAVAAAVQAGMDKRSQKLDITAERVLAELAKLAFFDARKLFDEAGMPRPITGLDDDTAAAIVGLDVVTMGSPEAGLGTVQKIKIADKRAALVDLGRHLKLFSDRIVIEDDSGLAERMANARKRAAEGAA